ncbi:HNH endonuclease signature motif containing protein [Trueperella bonasi]|uniref:HNH endonuclease signature motif containing protein n=1 Tax=Trueperella bonasi TaxID=312286 RepID=UPI00389A916F
MILADAQISRVVFGQESEVLDVGRRYRTATPAQARAVIARDRHCQFPGCTQPYSSSRIHHAHYWENGGNTDLDNLVMVCWHHHALIHREQITAIHYENGWEFVDVHGRVVQEPNDRQGRDDWWKRKCAENDQGRSVPISGIDVAS